MPKVLICFVYPWARYAVAGTESTWGLDLLAPVLRSHREGVILARTVRRRSSLMPFIGMFLEVKVRGHGHELSGAQMAELFVMCPECGLNAKLAPGEPQIKDDEGLCKHRQNPVSCPILGPILDAMRRASRR